MQTIVFPQLLRYMWSTSPVMQAVQFPRWLAVLGHADDMPVVALFSFFSSFFFTLFLSFFLLFIFSFFLIFCSFLHFLIF